MKNRTNIILGCIATTGVITTSILATKGHLKALSILEGSSDLTKKEQIKRTWVCYTPALLSGLITTGCISCIVGGNNKRNTAMMAVYGVMENRLFKYDGSFNDDKTVREVRLDLADDIMSEEFDKVRINHNEMVVYDMLSDRYFNIDIDEFVDMRELDNKDILINDLYKKLHLEPTFLGDKALVSGFNIFAATTPNGDTCVVLDIMTKSKYN